MSEIFPILKGLRGFPVGTSGKEPTCQCRKSRHTGWDPGLGRSPGERNSNAFSIFAWEIPWTEEPGRLQVMGSQSQTKLSMHTHTDTHTHTHTHTKGLKVASVMTVIS